MAVPLLAPELFAYAAKHRAVLGGLLFADGDPQVIVQRVFGLSGTCQRGVEQRIEDPGTRTCAEVGIEAIAMDDDLAREHGEHEVGHAAIGRHALAEFERRIGDSRRIGQIGAAVVEQRPQ